MNKELYELRSYISELAQNTPNSYPIKAVILRAKSLKEKFNIPHHSEFLPKEITQ